MSLAVLGRPLDDPRSTWYVWLLSFAAVIGGFLFGYDTGVVSSAMLYIPADLQLDYAQQQFVISVTVAVCALSALLSAVVNSYIGRRLSIMFASVVFTAASITLALANGYIMLVIGRAAIGLAIGFASTNVPPYVAECAPEHIRGKVLLMFQIMITFGILCANIFGGIFSIPFFKPDSVGWRLMFVTAALPAICQLVAFLFLPESPRFLISKQRNSDAMTVLLKIYGNEQWANYEQHQISQQLHKESIQNGNKNAARVMVEILQTPSVRRALLIGCSLQMFQQLSGINVIVYYSASIIRMSGITSSSETSVWISTVITSIKFMFTLLPAFLVEKYGRRPLLLTSISGLIVSLLLMGSGFLIISFTSDKIDVSQSIKINRLQAQLNNHNSSFANWSIADRKMLLKETINCAKKSSCDSCVTPEICGFCARNGRNIENASSTCLPVKLGDSAQSWIGNCANQFVSAMLTTREKSFGKQMSYRTDQEFDWAWDYCKSKYSPIVLVGMVLYLCSFSIGLGPMPWVVNAEIYPNWARSTAISLATFTNWAFNFMTAETFLMLIEALGKFGVFFMYAALTMIGLVVLFVTLPETKGIPIEHVQSIFANGTIRHAKNSDNITEKTNC